ncbi:MAG: preprotein translocase subunit SecA [Myxococcales bacterium]|nr:preprotein translocase subunit SecA [Myxococcales bacterium]
MISSLIKKVFGTAHERELKRLRPLVVQVNDLEARMKAKSDAELRAMTADFKQRLDHGATLKDLLPEAFATVREASMRVVGMRHYDVQLIGGMVLHRGAIAEMKTGEGKTLVATCPLYLNALEARGCHLITVNDYLATRDAEWMGRIYKFLGLSIGVIVHGQSDREKQENYRADITYGTNNEFGFDYLRDNMKESIERYVQRELHYAIVDEVDSILIDEARTPLIISGPAEDSADLYFRVNQIIPSLKKDVDFTLDEKAHSAVLTDQGVEKVEKKLGLANLYDAANIEWNHHVGKALSAHTLYKKDVNYVVEQSDKGLEIIIVDEFTGRKMPGRRWSDGLHQAIEAKENVPVQEENQTLATITFQNLFRMYSKLGGMTGTADTEAEEFHKIYKLDVVMVPTNLPMVRKDADDVVYKNERAKFKAVIEDIAGCHERGQPVLVGTVSVEKSEVLSSMLKKRGIPHTVLNAKYHMREAEIVAQAGRQGAVTISTNMAGRGTDILLGGNAEFMARAEVGGHEAAAIPGKVDDSTPEYKTAYEKYKAECGAEKKLVVAAGGLHILGTERHESRRIDNQLRGRAGRQGDPGSSRFYLSLEDDLMRIFGAERIEKMMNWLGGWDESEPIEAGLVNKAIENAQRKVEGHHFDVRKSLLDYDDVMNQQRKSIYALRRQILEGRYYPEQLEADKKKGKPWKPEFPTKSGEWTVDTLGDQIRPRVAQVIDAVLAAAQPTPGESADPYRASLDENRLGDPDKATHELYRVFGAVIDLKREFADREKAVTKAAREAASSLIQQRERILDLADELIHTQMHVFCPPKKHAEEWDLDTLRDGIKDVFNLQVKIDRGNLEREAIAEQLWEQLEKWIEARQTELRPLAFLALARHFYLDEIDNQWIDHLKSMDQLREGIGLRGYGQRDPKLEYKKEGYDQFSEMMARLSQNVAGKLFRVQLEMDQPRAPVAAAAHQHNHDHAHDHAPSNGEAVPEFKHKERRMIALHPGQAPGAEGGSGGPESAPEKQKTVVRDKPKVGRNEPCPCGSGKKYKKCHGATAVA